MNKNRFWPWKEFRRLEDELAHKNSEIRMHRDTICSLEQQLGDHVRLNADKDKHMRKLGAILAMSKGISVLFFVVCLNVFSQPTERNLFTTNPPPSVVSVQGPFVTTNPLPALTYNGGGISNIQSGSIGGFPAASSVASPFIGTNAGKMIITYNGNNITNLASTNIPSIPENFSATLKSDTLTFPSNQVAGFWIAVNQSTSDGSLIISASTDGGAGSGTASPAYILTNMSVQDSICIGNPPGYDIAYNGPGAGVNSNAYIHDSVTIQTGSSPDATNVDRSFIMGWGEVNNSQNIVQSAVIGGVQPGSWPGVDCYFNVYIGYESRVSAAMSQNFSNNVAIGWHSQTGTGNSNTVIGATAGSSLGSGFNNIEIGHPGAAADANVIRIGEYQNFAYMPGILTVTNGFRSYATNIQTLISSSGFTNDTTHGWGTNNMVVHLVAVGETVAFYMRSGANGQTSCGTLMGTDTGVALMDKPVGVNCGVAFSVGTFTSGYAYANP